MEDDDEFPDFDWSPWGRNWFLERKSLARATERQMRFACAYLRCGHQAKSAAEAGYRGDEDSLRQAGHRARQSKAVETLLGLAAVENDRGDEIADIYELKKIFSMGARAGSMADKIRAGDALVKLMQLEAKREEDRPRSPDQILGELAQEDPVLAEYLSKKYGVPIKSAAETTRQEGALA